MIHSFNEEKDKFNRKQAALSHELSDEELMELITQVETREMIHAPRHLKKDVLTRIRVQRQTAKKRQVFTYRAQVLIAMAAALTLLILMPGEGSGIEKITSNWQINQDAAEFDKDLIEEKAQKRQKEIDDEWTKYQERQERAGLKRELLESINGKWEAFEAYLEK